MYLLLNFLPLLIEVLISLIGPIKFNIVIFSFYFIWILFLLPTYLLAINLPHAKLGYKHLIRSSICMFSCLILRIFISLINHKIRYGEMIGDVPTQIYYIEIIIPSAIIIIGILIKYFNLKE